MFPIAPTKTAPPGLCAPKMSALWGGICLSGVMPQPPESKCSETFVNVRSVLLSISRIQDLGVLTLSRAVATAVIASAMPFTSVTTSMNPMKDSSSDRSRRDHVGSVAFSGYRSMWLHARWWSRGATHARACSAVDGCACDLESSFSLLGEFPFGGSAMRPHDSGSALSRCPVSAKGETPRDRRPSRPGLDPGRCHMPAGGGSAHEFTKVRHRAVPDGDPVARGEEVLNGGGHVGNALRYAAAARPYRFGPRTAPRGCCGRRNPRRGASRLFHPSWTKRRTVSSISVFAWQLLFRALLATGRRF